MLLGDGRLVFFTEFLSGWRIRSENYLGGFQIYSLISTLLEGVSKSRVLAEVQILQKC